MATRFGIELSPVDCRIVEIDSGPSGPDAPDTCVRSMFIAPIGSGDTRAQLARLKGREVAVVAWGLRGDHRQAVVNAGRWEAMRHEAITSLRSAGIDTHGVLTDIAPAGPQVTNGTRSRRPIVMALASRNDIGGALRPLRAAGIRVKSVVTPGAALGSLARLRRGRGAAPGVEAYVALEETATCIALIRDHVLVGARELPWGYVHEHEPFGDRVPREKVAARLADELVDFFSTAGVEPGSIGAICICGALPEIGGMSMLLMQKLELSVEPLDSMFGIDTDSRPDAAGDFCDRSVEMRLAWAAAADWKAPLNLLREARHQAIAAVFARAAVVAGVATGVTLGWALKGTPWLQAPAVVSTIPSSRIMAIPDILPPIRSVQPVASTLAGSGSNTTVSVGSAGVTAGMNAAKPVARLAVPRAAPIIRHEPPVFVEPVAVVRRPVSPAPRPVAMERHLGSILFGPDRQVAMIDGQIVEAGDDVQGAMVVEISPTTVTLRDGSGRLHRLSLKAKRQ